MAAELLDSFLAIAYKSSVFLFLIIVSYVVYQRFLHPLARFPGPFICSVTDFWKLWITITEQVPEQMVRLHEQYGDVVRIGPNELHFNQAAAIDDIYKHGWEKGDFYLGFGFRVAGLFSERDSAVHAKRKRMFADNFSTSALRTYESTIDSRFSILRTQLDGFAKKGTVFDLRHYITYTMVDILSILAFSEPFGNQRDQDPSKIPAVADSLYMCCVLGQVKWIAVLWEYTNKYLPMPETVAAQRDKVLNLAIRNVQARFGKSAQQDDILGRILAAREEQTGEQLSMQQIVIEAVTLVVGGTHTTGNTLHLLIANLARHPETLRKIIEEIDTRLPTLGANEACYGITGLEEKLDFVNACIKETFRNNPVATFNQPRTVPEGGAAIAGTWIPAGTQVSINQYAMHHNPRIWGSDHKVFDPTRWYDERTAGVGQFLIPFNVGNRACAGRNLAKANILKMITTLLRCYTFEFLNADEPMRVVTHGDAELRTPIMVRCKMRQ